jgi:rubrerythrin
MAKQKKAGKGKVRSKTVRGKKPGSKKPTVSKPPLDSFKACPMVFKSPEEILKYAIQREEESAAGYARMRRRARTESQKALLSDMEDEEKKHKQLLLGLSAAELKSIDIKPIADLKISDYLVAEPAGEGMTFQDLLILAAKKEQSAADLYAKLESCVLTPELNKLFEFLVQQEKSHKLKLETEYEKHVMPED